MESQALKSTAKTARNMLYHEVGQKLNVALIEEALKKDCTDNLPSEEELESIIFGEEGNEGVKALYPSLSKLVGEAIGSYQGNKI